MNAVGLGLLGSTRCRGTRYHMPLRTTTLYNFTINGMCFICSPFERLTKRRKQNKRTQMFYFILVVFLVGLVVFSVLLNTVKYVWPSHVVDDNNDQRQPHETIGATLANPVSKLGAT